MTEQDLHGRWSNGDPVHVITDGIDRWIAPNHSGATWISEDGACGITWDDTHHHRCEMVGSHTVHECWACETRVPVGGVSPTAPDEADLAQALFRTLYDAGVSFNSNDLIPRLTATVLAAGYRHMPEVTAPDEREEREELIALRLASYPKRMSDGYNSVVVRSNEDAADVVLAAGFRRSREATTEPQPITDANAYAAHERKCGCALLGCEFIVGWRAALEAVEASRSPKPTEVER